MAHSLISGDCSNVGDANAQFAEEKGLLVLRPGRNCCCVPYFTVPSGCYALVTRHGADMDYVGENGEKSAVWPAGLHYPFPPWVQVSNLVTMQSIVLDLPNKACKTKDNVSVNIDVGLVFRIMGDKDRGEDPELVRKFVYQVKPRGLEQQLRDAQEEAVRALARGLNHTHIYGIRSGGAKDRGKNAEGEMMQSIADEDVSAEESEAESEDSTSIRDPIFSGTSDDSDRKAAKKARRLGEGMAAMMRARLNKQFMPQGVEILSVMIKSIQLPSNIESQMKEKTMNISQLAQQRMYHENEMQNTRMDQQVETMLQRFHEEREQEASSGAEIINAESVKLNDAVALASKSEANIREETKAKIENLRAKSELEVQRVRDKAFETETKIKTEAEKEAAEFLAKTRYETQTLISESELQATRNSAKAAEIVSKAEGTIAPMVAKKKEHETRVKELDVYRTLSANENLVVSGSTDESVNLVTVADAILQDMDKAENRTAILAELAIMSKGSSAFMSGNQESNSST